MTIVIVTILGAAAGFIYWKIFGCAFGICPLSQNKYMSALVGALIGLLMITSTSCSGQTVEPVTGQQTTIQASVVKEDVAPDVFAGKMEAENTVLLDVRTPEEFAAGHIPNAINLNYNAPDFTEQVNKLDKSKTYLVYCKAGSRSAGAANIMSTNGFHTIYNLKGGIMAWPNPLEK